MARRRVGWRVVVVALMSFAGLAVLPLTYQDSPSTESPAWVHAARHTVAVPQAPSDTSLPPVKLSAVALPINPDAAPGSLPALDSNRMAALVASEDLRLRVLLHHVSVMTAPAVVPVYGSLPTLVLPGRPAPYSVADLKSFGALTARPDGGFMLVDSILAAPGATLQISGMSTLLLDSSTAGFTSLVTWGGVLTLSGASPQAPLTITGWDHGVNLPAADTGHGRPYIRAVGGRLDIRNVRASSLGFWSGRTGGVAWTGVSSRPATGGAVSSTFTGNAYGAFVSRADKVQFNDDLFEGNELDGLRLHRYATNSTVTASAAVRNGGNGFVVSRGATGDLLQGDLSLHNMGNGFLLDGQPLVSGASPSGGRTIATVGTRLESSAAEANARTGILVDGGAGTIVKANTVCGPVTGIAVRAGATGTMLVGNDIRCGGRVAISIGPAVTGTTVAGNTLNQARIGILIRNSPGARIINNRITGMILFGVSVRGASPGVVGDGNTIAGQGFNPIDVRGGAVTPPITNTDLTGWQRRSELTVFGYLRYHPILTTWLGILIVVAMASVVAARRPRPQGPYRYTARWHQAAPSAPATSIPAAAEPAPGFGMMPAWTEPAVASRAE